MKVKNLLILATILLNSTVAFSQKENTGKRDNLLFLLRQTEHINQALKTVEQLQSNAKATIKTGKIVIIVCGEAVTTLSTEAAKEWVSKIKSHPQVSILACGLSLDKFKISQNNLVEGIGYTRNGFIKAFELQKQGYLSVEL